MDYKELGNRVREARTIYGITQSNLAERVGCSVQHMRNLLKYYMYPDSILIEKEKR